MCWVLDRGLRGACVRVQGACAFARVLMCVFVSSCARAVRACVTACLCERKCVFVRFHRIAIPRACVASAVRATALCAPSHRTAATGGIYSSARAARRLPRACGCGSARPE